MEGCGAYQVFSRAPFHCKFLFHSYYELQEAGFGDVGGLSQFLCLADLKQVSSYLQHAH